MFSEPMRESDHAVVSVYHEKMGFDYKMPSLDDKRFVVKHVVRDTSGVVLGAGAVRVQAETYLWLDTELPVRVRLQVVLTLGRSLADSAWRAGLDSLCAWLPPGLPKSFKKVLGWLGWSADRSGWQSWTKPLE